MARAEEGRISCKECDFRLSYSLLAVNSLYQRYLLFSTLWSFAAHRCHVSQGTRVIRPGGNAAISEVAKIDTPDFAKPKTSWMSGRPDVLGVGNGL